MATHLVVAGLVPAIPINWALDHPDRDRLDKPGDVTIFFARTGNTPAANGNLADTDVFYGAVLCAALKFAPVADDLSYRNSPISSRINLAHAPWGNSRRADR